MIRNINTRKCIRSDLTDYTVFDLETIGVNIYYCEIIELSAVKIRGSKLLMNSVRLLNSEDA